VLGLRHRLLTVGHCQSQAVKTAIVLASGPSLTLEQIDAARRSGHYTIVVNSTYQKFLDANVLYAGDFMWWKVHYADVKAKFKGKLWTQDSSVAARWPGINRERGTNREGLGKEVIHQNGNSGVQALNLAYLWGYDRIILLGFDMKLGPNGERHHHPDHPAPCVLNQTFGEWLHKLEKVAHDFKTTKCEVLNATPGSAMKCFPMVDWWEVL
jgi:hypothetical protein